MNRILNNKENKIEKQLGWDDYVITIRPDGIGHYYDFTGVSDGVERTSSNVYKCTER